MEAIAILFAIGILMALNVPEPKQEPPNKAEVLAKALKDYLDDRGSGR